MKQDNPLHIAFAPWMVAGVRTQWENMAPHISGRPDVCAHVVEVYPFKSGGLIEGLPFVPSTAKGNLRSMVCTGKLFRLPPLDAVCVNTRTGLPYILSKALLHRTVVVSMTDVTMVQMANFGGLYGKTPNESLYGRMRTMVDTFCARRATFHAPWSQWTARSLHADYGIPWHKIHVSPPGINLDLWPMQHRPRTSSDVPRLLFVGGDFARKGGDLLLDVFERRLRGRCELHLVTRDNVPEQPGVFVYRNFGPNAPGLRALYTHCDIFVLPTRADCFSLASMEAMATGLPVVTSTIGGIPEIVAEGRTGFLIAPDDGMALIQRLEALIDRPEQRIAMGTEGRRIVEARFDAARNTAHLLDLITDYCRRRRTAHTDTTANQRRS